MTSEREEIKTKQIQQEVSLEIERSKVTILNIRTGFKIVWSKQEVYLRYETPAEFPGEVLVVSACLHREPIWNLNLQDSGGSYCSHSSPPAVPPGGDPWPSPRCLHLLHLRLICPVFLLAEPRPQQELGGDGGVVRDTVRVLFWNFDWVIKFLGLFL